MYEMVWGTVYVGLVINMAFVLVNLPLVVLILLPDPLASWPLLTLAIPLLAPALLATFTMFGAFSEDPTTKAMRTFFTAWRRHLPKFWAMGFGVCVVVTIATLNTIWLMGEALGAMVIPIQVVLTTVVLIATLHALVLRAARPELRLSELLPAGLLLGLRRWYFTLPALFVLGLLGQLILTQPAIGLGFATSPLLYATWGLCRFALHPVLPVEPMPA